LSVGVDVVGISVGRDRAAL